MGIFGNIFGKSTNESKAKQLPWIALSSIDQFDDIIEKSNERPQLVFKHSTTCGISAMVLQRLTDSYSLGENQVDLYFLDLHAYRNISNEVAQRFQVVHQSPQLLVLTNEKVVFHTSHGAINEVDLAQFLP